ncbi:MAG TPA: efflux RND transporter periplasmic adaptor subunit [Candidatus Sulfopaludibacter sp.]|jgi:RND family efflux transporter MFP subunit|nr:efflux RND transporter periplasmic adaptor subunit [Candidatus Sulfopaludibacter sp.]
MSGRKSGLALLVMAATAMGQALDGVKVVARAVDRTIVLPGEFVPFLSVPIHAKIAGFVDKVEVDRGSVVKEGQLLATMTAPELASQKAEAEARVRSAEAQRVEAEARLVAAQSTYDRMKAASATPGVIAGNELVQAEKQVDAERAKIRAQESLVQAAQASVKAVEDLQAYLRVTAPFAGVITTRNVHPGALVGTGESSLAMFQLETVDRLRLVVPVPEADVGGIVQGARVAFTVPAYPTETFTGTVRRIARSMDAKTRSMPVELDVMNPQGKLAAGMYPAVKWPVHVKQAALLVPATSVVTTSERTFVVRVRDGMAEWVDVKKGPSQGDLVEVLGALASGDTVLKRGSDEIRQGTRVEVKLGK